MADSAGTRPLGPSCLERHQFMAAIAGCVLAAPRAANAQGAAKTWRIGWLSSRTGRSDDANFVALQNGLRELGYLEGRNIVFEKRWSGGVAEQLPGLAAELVRTKVDVICTTGTPASMAAKGATTSIPIVFAAVAFPDQSHLVATYAHPGANITGVAFVDGEYGKRLELLKEALPRSRRVALIYNSENRASVLALEETQRWAKSLDVVVEPHSLRGPQDLRGIFEAIARARPDAVMTTADTYVLSHQTSIVELAAKSRLPSIFPDRQFVQAGGLMFYGSSIAEMYRRAAAYVDRILKGAKPADLPVERPVKFDLIINLKTAKALRLSLSQSLVARADRVIE